jgi:hypothetical protein
MNDRVNVPTAEILTELLSGAGIEPPERPVDEVTITLAVETVRSIAGSDANVNAPAESVVLPVGWTDQYVSLRGVAWHATQVFFAVFALAKTGGLTWIGLGPILLDALDKLRKDFAILQPGEVQFYDAVLRASRARMTASTEPLRDARFVTEDDVRAQLGHIGRADQVGLDRILEGLSNRGILESRIIDAVKRYAVRM